VTNSLSRSCHMPPAPRIACLFSRSLARRTTAQNGTRVMPT